ncbi:uncharacterized protein LOC131167435 [Malania oleifera]|uniref:uncharacterized protein LOC131167435 n=1 Tax=Malania oleifera TaxID=397392 RepID=UPI0025AEBE8C|nr:uncharacterized protein LOC131167435 [Malania oleifera]
MIFLPTSTVRCFRPKFRISSSENDDPPPQPQSPYESKKKKKKQQDSREKISGSANVSKPFPPASIQNVVSELVEGEQSVGVIENIFRLGWTDPSRFAIEKILKVNHSAEVLDRFEAHRETIKSRDAETGERKRTERLAVDGNELLRFHGGIVACSLGFDGGFSICEKKSCGICRILGFRSWGEAGYVSLLENSRKAHEKATGDSISNGVCGRKAIIMCRVIAGRVAECRENGTVDGEKGGFDSMVASSSGNEIEELIVWNLRAVLPCFVVIYNAV